MSSRDLKRYEALRELGCIACRQNGVNLMIPEVHHLVDKGYRKHSGGNQATIPLCIWHHRGQHPSNLTAEFMRGSMGPSMFHESKEFARVFGTQRTLLAKVNQLLAGSNP